MSQECPTPAISARFPDLAGKVAIVTGASRGIGPGIAEVLGTQGMSVVLTARSDQAGRDVADGLRARGIRCLWARADLTSADDAQRVLDATIAEYQRVDLLVNNAANIRSKPFQELDDEALAVSLEANARMMHRLSYRVVRRMIAAGTGGSIVNISSVGGLRAHRRHAGYDASKGAMDALTRAMAVDLAPHRIRVNAVAPGATWDMGDVSPRYAERIARMAANIPLGRLAHPHEIGAAVAFLASDAGAYITGAVLYVDGGLTAQLSPPGIWV